MIGSKLVGVTMVAMLGAGCSANVRPIPVPVPGDPAGRTAATILNDCRGSDRSRQMECHESSVLRVLEEEGVAEAMAVTERMGDLDQEVERQGHVYAHAIGLAAYSTPEEVGEVFASCTPSYQSGCYHGVIQSYFVDVAQGDAAAVDEQAINALCADQRSDTGDQWLLFQCAHGVGHGVTLINDHHLPSSLGACDLITSEWERDACYGGVFMENIVQATAPHHSMGRPRVDDQAAGPHAGHHPPATEEATHHGGHPETGDREEFPPLVPDDPLYPCTALPDRYLVSCYHMQTSAVLFFNGGDLAGAAEACDTAPERYRSACFRSLGRDVSAITVQDHDSALELCARTGDRRYDCHWGYVKNVVDVTARAEDGFDFCALVPDDEGKRRCYEAVGEQVWVLAGDEPGREAMCAPAEPAYVQACRRGAALPATSTP